MPPSLQEIHTSSSPVPNEERTRAAVSTHRVLLGSRIVILWNKKTYLCRFMECPGYLSALANLPRKELMRALIFGNADLYDIRCPCGRRRKPFATTCNEAVSWRHKRLCDFIRTTPYCDIWSADERISRSFVIRYSSLSFKMSLSEVVAS